MRHSDGSYMSREEMSEWIIKLENHIKAQEETIGIQARRIRELETMERI